MAIVCDAEAGRRTSEGPARAPSSRQFLADNKGSRVTLLSEVEQGVLNGAQLGPSLLKLRFLASKLGSRPLEEWVKHETEGYPQHVDVPDYRKIGVSYRGTFTDGRRMLYDVPVASYLINRLAGEKWVRYEVRSSMSSIDELICNPPKGKSIGIESAGDLAFLLESEVYEGFSCLKLIGELFESIVHKYSSGCEEQVIRVST